MNELEFYNYLLAAWFSTSFIVLFALFMTTAPYGRHFVTARVRVPARVGWLLMESPMVFGFVTCYALGEPNTVAWIFFALFQLHYVNRSLIFPMRLSNATPMPSSVVLYAFTFTSVTSYLLARGLSHFGPIHSSDWLMGPQFIIGVCLFLLGFCINIKSDAILFNLRKSGKRKYLIPEGGLYRFVSCPNYLGEIIEWIGWAIMTWSLAGVGFAFWTFANLAPRARAHHAWYKKEFVDYPAKRKALIPFIF